MVDLRGRKFTSKFYHNLCYQSHKFGAAKSQQSVENSISKKKNKKKRERK